MTEGHSYNMKGAVESAQSVNNAASGTSSSYTTNPKGYDYDFKGLVTALEDVAETVGGIQGGGSGSIDEDFLQDNIAAGSGIVIRPDPTNPTGIIISASGTAEFPSGSLQVDDLKNGAYINIVASGNGARDNVYISATGLQPEGNYTEFDDFVGGNYIQVTENGTTVTISATGLSDGFQPSGTYLTPTDVKGGAYVVTSVSGNETFVSVTGVAGLNNFVDGPYIQTTISGDKIIISATGVQAEIDPNATTVSDTAPPSPKAGDLWYCSNTEAEGGGRLFIYYSDADSQQWVDVSLPTGGSSGSGITEVPNLQQVTDKGATTTKTIYTSAQLYAQQDITSSGFFVGDGSKLTNLPIPSTSGAVGDLQQVTDNGSTTTNSITAASFNQPNTGISIFSPDLSKEGSVIGGNGLAFFYYNRGGSEVPTDCVWVNNVTGGLRLGNSTADINNPKVNIGTEGSGYFLGDVVVSGYFIGDGSRLSNLPSAGGIPTLQQVTDSGNTTTNNILTSGVVNALSFKGDGSTLDNIVTSVTGGVGIAVTQSTGDIEISLAQIPGGSGFIPGSGVITVTQGTDTLGSFNVNQTGDQTIEIPVAGLPGSGDIELSSSRGIVGVFNVNQPGNETILFPDPNLQEVTEQGSETFIPITVKFANRPAEVVLKPEGSVNIKADVGQNESNNLLHLTNPSGSTLAKIDASGNLTSISTISGAFLQGDASQLHNLPKESGTVGTLQEVTDAGSTTTNTIGAAGYTGDGSSLSNIVTTLTAGVGLAVTQSTGAIEVSLAQLPSGGGFIPGSGVITIAQGQVQGTVSVTASGWSNPSEVIDGQVATVAGSNNFGENPTAYGTVDFGEELTITKFNVYSRVYTATNEFRLLDSAKNVVATLQNSPQNQAVGWLTVYEGVAVSARYYEQHVYDDINGVGWTSDDCGAIAINTVNFVANDVVDDGTVASGTRPATVGGTTLGSFNVNQTGNQTIIIPDNQDTIPGSGEITVVDQLGNLKGQFNVNQTNDQTLTVSGIVPGSGEIQIKDTGNTLLGTFNVNQTANQTIVVAQAPSGSLDAQHLKGGAYIQTVASGDNVFISATGVQPAGNYAPSGNYLEPNDVVGGAYINVAPTTDGVLLSATGIPAPAGKGDVTFMQGSATLGALNVDQEGDSIISIPVAPSQIVPGSGVISILQDGTTLGAFNVDQQGDTFITIPTVAPAAVPGSGVITLNQGGVAKGTFNVNQQGSLTVDLDSGGGNLQEITDSGNTTTNAIFSSGVVGAASFTGDGSSLTNIVTNLTAGVGLAVTQSTGQIEVSLAQIPSGGAFIPGSGVITITQGASTLGTFNVNQTGDTNIVIPVDESGLTTSGIIGGDYIQTVASGDAVIITATGVQPSGNYLTTPSSLQEVTDAGSTTTNTITASGFVGDGSQLTNVPQPTIPTIGSGIITLQDAEGNDLGKFDVNQTNDEVITISGTGGSTGASVTVADTAPGTPAAGDLWYCSSTEVEGGSRLYIYYQDENSSQWVDVSLPSVQDGVFVSDTAPIQAANGDLWFCSDTQSKGGMRLYCYFKDADGEQWVDVSLPTGGGSSSDPVAAPLFVDIPLLGGDVIVGGDITSSIAVPKGGEPPYTVEYVFEDNDTNVLQSGDLHTYVTQPNDVGYEIDCYVVATDSEGTRYETDYSNALGPIVQDVFLKTPSVVSPENGAGIIIADALTSGYITSVSSDQTQLTFSSNDGFDNFEEGESIIQTRASGIARQGMGLPIPFATNAVNMQENGGVPLATTTINVGTTPALNVVQSGDVIGQLAPEGIAAQRIATQDWSSGVVTISGAGVKVGPGPSGLNPYYGQANLGEGYTEGWAPMFNGSARANVSTPTNASGLPSLKNSYGEDYYPYWEYGFSSNKNTIMMLDMPGGPCSAELTLPEPIPCSDPNELLTSIAITFYAPFGVVAPNRGGSNNWYGLVTKCGLLVNGKKIYSYPKSGQNGNSTDPDGNETSINNTFYSVKGYGQNDYETGFGYCTISSSDYYDPTNQPPDTKGSRSGGLYGYFGFMPIFSSELLDILTEDGELRSIGLWSETGVNCNWQQPYYDNRLTPTQNSETFGLYKVQFGSRVLVDKSRIKDQVVVDKDINKGTLEVTNVAYQTPMTETQMGDFNDSVDNIYIQSVGNINCVRDQSLSEFATKQSKMSIIPTLTGGSSFSITVKKAGVLRWNMSYHYLFSSHTQKTYGGITYAPVNYDGTVFIYRDVKTKYSTDFLYFTTVFYGPGRVEIDLNVGSIMASSPVAYVNTIRAATFKFSADAAEYGWPNDSFIFSEGWDWADEDIIYASPNRTDQSKSYGQLPNTNVRYRVPIINRIENMAAYPSTFWPNTYGVNYTAGSGVIDTIDTANSIINLTSGNTAANGSRFVPNLYVKALTGDNSVAPVANTMDFIGSIPATKEESSPVTTWDAAYWQISTDPGFASFSTVSDPITDPLITQELTPSERSNVTLLPETEYYARVQYDSLTPPRSSDYSEPVLFKTAVVNATYATGDTYYDFINKQPITAGEIKAKYGLDPATVGTAKLTQLGYAELTAQPVGIIAGYIQVGNKYKPVRDRDAEIADILARLATLEGS